MLRNPKGWVVTPMMFLVLLATAGAALAAPPEVHDEAAFFSPSAVQKANEAIRELKQRQKLDFQIETYKTVPANQMQRFKGLNKAEQDRFFEQWAKDRATRLKLDGVLVLITKDPAHLFVLASSDTPRKGMSNTDRERLQSLIIARFRDKKYDEALSEAVTFARREFGLNTATAGGSSTAAPPAAANDVKDTGKFFTAPALQTANQDLKDLKQKFNIDAFVETYATVPADKVQQVNGMSPAARNQFFADWLAERMKATKPQSVFVLVTKEPAHFQIGMGDNVKTKAFTPLDRQNLVQLLTERLREKKNDQALLDTTAFIYDTVDKNLSPQPLAPVLGSVKDNAGLFSAGAVQKAAADISSIKQDFKMDLLVETFKTPPPGKVKATQHLSAEQQKKFFDDWAQDRARMANLKGMYVLVCDTPRTVALAVTEPVRPNVASPNYIASLGNQLMAKQADDGLLDTTAAVWDRLDAERSPALPEPVPGMVKDHAGLFTAEAIQKANGVLTSFKEKHKKDVWFETFKTPPPGSVKRIERAGGERRDQIFTDFAQARNRKAETNANYEGIHVVVCQQPPLIAVTADLETAKVFTPYDQRVLRSILASQLTGDQKDRALGDALVFIDESLRAPRVADRAGLFKPTALQQANDQVKDIRRRAKIDLLITSFADNASKPAAPNAESNLIVLLIQKQPLEVEVIRVGEGKKLFGDADQTLLNDMLATRFRGTEDDRYDRGLIAATEFVRDTVVAKPVFDDGGFFSPEKIEAANTAIRKLRRDAKKDLVIETFKEVPADKAKDVNLGNAEARAKLFEAWGRERLTGADGIGILICKNPPYLHVSISPQTLNHGFTSADRDKLKVMLMDKLKAKQHDEALQESITQVATTLKANVTAAPVPPKATAPAVGITKTIVEPTNKNDNQAVGKAGGAPMAGGDGGNFMWIVWIIGGVLVVWLFIGFIRMITGSGRRQQQQYGPGPGGYPPQGGYPGGRPGYGPGYGQGGGYGPGYGGGGGGGGFWSGMLGGMFGAAAGNWIYDSFARRPSPGTGFTPSARADSPQQDYSGGGGDYGSSGQPEPYAGSGGDYGNSPDQGGGVDTGGGADYGGNVDIGNTGGGDYGGGGGDYGGDTGGGGDYGGGGGDFGGGGGDFGGGGGDFGGGGDAGGGGGGDF